MTVLSARPAHDLSQEEVASEKRTALKNMTVLSARPVHDMSQEGVASEKSAALKNILLVSTSFLLLFTAFRGLLRLQSSLHSIAGMGVLSQVSPINMPVCASSGPVASAQYRPGTGTYRHVYGSDL